MKKKRTDEERIKQMVSEMEGKKEMPEEEMEGMEKMESMKSKEMMDDDMEDEEKPKKGKLFGKKGPHISIMISMGKKK